MALWACWIVTARFSDQLTNTIQHRQITADYKLLEHFNIWSHMVWSVFNSGQSMKNAWKCVCHYSIDDSDHVVSGQDQPFLLYVVLLLIDNIPRKPYLTSLPFTCAVKSHCIRTRFNYVSDSLFSQLSTPWIRPNYNIGRFWVVKISGLSVRYVQL